MKNHKILLSVLTLTTLSFFFSCSKSATNELHDAQLCLNKATASEALGCIDKISSDTSPLAYSLRCSSIFISQGFGSASSFVQALDSINQAGNCTGGCSSTVNALYSLNFKAAGIATQPQRDTNNAAAADAFAQCSLADAKIYTQIASLFRLGTMSSMLAYTVSGGAAITQDNLETQLANLSPSAVGSIAIVTYQNTCQDLTKASDSTKAYCAELQASINGGANSTTIGTCFLNKLQNPAYVCP